MPAEQKREEQLTSYPMLEKKCDGAAAGADSLPQGKAAGKQQQLKDEQQQHHSSSKQQRQQEEATRGEGRSQEANAQQAAAETHKHKEPAAAGQQQQKTGEKNQRVKEPAAERMEEQQQQQEGSKRQTAEEEEEEGDSEGGGKEGEGGDAGGGTGGGKKKKKKKKKKKSAAAKAAAAPEGDAANAAGTAPSAAAAAQKQDSAGAAAKGKAGVLRGAAAAEAAAAAARENSSLLRRVGLWKAFPQGQTWPPTESMQRLYPDGAFPPGEMKQLLNSKKGTAEAEKRESMRLQEVDIDTIREAAECHRQVRRYVQGIARPGIPLMELCEKLEAKSRELLGCGTFGSSNSSSNSSSKSPLERGWGFPTGCSINNCAAHYTPNPGDRRLLEAGDICKLDFGVQVKGRIIDCAFSIAFDEKFDPLIQATQDGTNAGLAHAGVDARLSEIGGYIQEAIESYEMEIDGKAHPIKAIRNLTGHSIDLYKIHAGKSVPIVKAPSSCGAVSSGPSNRMEEGEVYAIECFASTGRAIVLEEGECSHFMKNADVGFAPLRLKSAKDLLKVIDENFGTLAFCRRWLEDLGCSHHLMALKQLVEKQIVTPYPPLSDVKKSFTSQMEHTVFIGSHSVEVVSRGDDY